MHSHGNAIDHNNFIDNNPSGAQAYDDTGTNHWNTAGNEGNYWNDWTSPDVNGDGIVDNPYLLDGGAGAKDYYPLTNPLDLIPPISSHDYDGLWHTTDFTITLTATDDMSGVAETCYKINEGLNKTVSADGQPRITTEGANNTLEYWSVDNAGNEELPHKILTGIKLDKTAPVGFITINDYATYTNSTSVTLTLTATDATSGVAEMRFSNDNTTYTDWQTYTTSKSWTLKEGDGTKTVYVQFKDHTGLISTYSDTIILDTTPPTGSVIIAEGVTYTNSTSVTLTLSADDETSGVAQMRFSNDNISWSDWEAYASSKAWMLTAGDGTKTVYVQFMNNAGLISPTYEDTIILDTTRPTANAGVDQTVNEDTIVTFNASASTDENGIKSCTCMHAPLPPQLHWVTCRKQY